MSYFDGIVGDGIVNSYVKKGQMINNEGGMSKYITMAQWQTSRYLNPPQCLMMLSLNKPKLKVSEHDFPK